jgi:hypothetical protein
MIRSPRTQGNIHEDQILRIIASFPSLSCLEKIHTFFILCRNVTRENSALILAFILELQDNSIEIPAMASRSLDFHLLKLKSLLEKQLSSECLYLLEGLTHLPTKEYAQVEFNEHEYLVTSIMEALITYNTKEIDNFVKNFYEPKGKLDQSFNIPDFFLEEIRANWQQLRESKRHMFKCLKDEDLPPFLGFLDRSNDAAQDFILCVYFFNKAFYRIFVDAVYTRELQSLYELLPEIDIGRINIKDMSFDMYKALVVNRPSTRNVLLELLFTNRIGYERSSIVNLVAENYNAFTQKIALFEFDIDESLVIAEKNREIIWHVVQGLEQLDHASIAKIAQFLVKEDDQFIKSLFLPTIRTDSKSWIELINLYLRSKPLSEDLKAFFLYHLSDNANYFYSLMPYFKREKNLEALSRLLVDEESLRYFMRVFTLNEIFYLAHYVSDIERAKNCIKLCINNPAFNESVVLFAIPKMEMDILPPLFMRSVILSYMKLPSLKGFVINLMHKLVKRAIWLDAGLFEGFIKALEVIGNESVGIIAQMPPDQIAEVLRKSRKLINISKKHFSEVREMKDKNEKRFRNILSSFR